MRDLAGLDAEMREQPFMDADVLQNPGADRGLFSALSREICRPLISLCAGFDLLLAGCEGPVSPEQRDQVQSLRGHCDDLIRLTRSYLDHAAPPREPREPDWAPFRLGALLEESDRQFSGMAVQRGIAWSCRLEGEDGTVSTDLACFQRVLGRLVTNAMSHTPDGGRVDVSARIVGDDWTLTVADDGRGIPPEMFDHVFEPLVRVPSAVHKQGMGPGHGMGLPVCRELIDRLGGTIRLDSQPGRGTSASVRFPTRRPC
jgi:signal transduction histidine kinase